MQQYLSELKRERDQRKEKKQLSMMAQQSVATTPLEPSRKLVCATNQGTHASVTSERSGTTIVRACERTSDRATVWFPNNQYLESALQLTNQVAPASSTYIAQSGALKHTSLVGSPRRASPAGSAFLSSSLLYTFWLVTFNTVSLQPALTFSPLGHRLSQRRQEDIAGDQCSQVCSVATRHKSQSELSLKYVKSRSNQLAVNDLVLVIRLTHLIKRIKKFMESATSEMVNLVKI